MLRPTTARADGRFQHTLPVDPTEARLNDLQRSVERLWLCGGIAALFIAGTFWNQQSQLKSIHGVFTAFTTGMERANRSRGDQGNVQSK